MQYLERSIDHFVIAVVKPEGAEPEHTQVVVVLHCKMAHTTHIHT